MTTKTWNISANGIPFGAYRGETEADAALAYVKDAGYASIEEAAEVVEKTFAEFMDGMEIEASISNRLSIVNAKFVEASDDLARHVAFDVAVDGEIVGSTLEWLDEDHDLVRDDCHLDINPDVLKTVADRLDEDYDDVYVAALQLLEAAVEELKEPQQDLAGEMFPELA
ncbi:hypothetical protein CFBP5875_01455 [Agrobacterium pusense]|uniref:hypothetical protein n=1 Tax=Agrobacterium pusense TaxID=648995 RepID=UPI0010BEA559|nr:hypothetical protein [Agrobacterium pusense]QCL83359.1 hypothetical protein CFBP5875_01455 [Agrobacterium pusense]